MLFALKYFTAMVKIGNYNTLEIVKIVDFGVYLDGGNGVEILLPSRYINEVPHVGDVLDVFVYTDSEDRLIATTERPYLTVGEFGYLRVVQVNSVGAFLDWGLPKNLLVPFREQKLRMIQDKSYLVYVYLDDATKRIVASAKVDKFIGNKFPDYKRGAKVEILVYQQTEIGYKAIVDNLYAGMLYENELYRSVNPGERLEAYVKTVRDDGKIDLTLSGSAGDRVQELADRIYKWMVSNGGEVSLCDKSSPEEIKKEMSCSKKDFKKAVGQLFKSRKIELLPNGMRIVK